MMNLETRIFIAKIVEGHLNSSNIGEHILHTGDVLIGSLRALVDAFPELEDVITKITSLLRAGLDEWIEDPTILYSKIITQDDVDSGEIELI